MTDEEMENPDYSEEYFSMMDGEEAFKWAQKIPALLAGRRTLEEQNEILRAALSFYADPNNLTIKVILMPENREYFVDTGTPFHNDRGITARRALEMVGPGPEKPKPEEIKEEPIVIDSETQRVVDEVMAANPKHVTDYLAGKTKTINSLIGNCMKALNRRGQPVVVKTALENRLQEIKNGR